MYERNDQNVRLMREWFMRNQVLGMGEADIIGRNLYSKPPKRVIVYHNNIPSPLKPLLTLINSRKQQGRQVKVNIPQLATSLFPPNSKRLFSSLNFT
jgi:hypothetical protein